MEKQLNKKSKINKTSVYIFLIRWWSTGAMFFLIAWGTNVGSYNTIIDLVFLLAIGIGLFNSFIVNPSIKMIFNVGNGKEYKDMKVSERILLRLKDVGKALVIVGLIALFYQLVNIGAIKLLGLAQEHVFLPAEPIIFGLLYALFCTLGAKLFANIKRLKDS